MLWINRKFESVRALLFVSVHVFLSVGLVDPWTSGLRTSGPQYSWPLGLMGDSLLSNLDEIGG